MLDAVCTCTVFLPSKWPAERCGKGRRLLSCMRAFFLPLPLLSYVHVWTLWDFLWIRCVWEFILHGWRMRRLFFWSVVVSRLNAAFDSVFGVCRFTWLLFISVCVNVCPFICHILWNLSLFFLSCFVVCSFRAHTVSYADGGCLDAKVCTIWTSPCPSHPFVTATLFSSSPRSVH